MVECHDGICTEGTEQAPANSNFEMPMMAAPFMPSFGNIEREMQNEMSGVESHIRHDMQAMDDNFARMEHSIGDNLKNLDNMHGDGNSQSFSMSSESSMGADGKMHQHSNKHGATTSCRDGECHQISCSDGKC